MIEGPAFQQFGRIAQKWRELAERRREYFAELYRTGRWKLYYNEHQLLMRMRDVVATCERWATIAPPNPDGAVGEPQAPGAAAVERRKAA